MQQRSIRPGGGDRDRHDRHELGGVFPGARPRGPGQRPGARGGGAIAPFCRRPPGRRWRGSGRCRSAPAASAADFPRRAGKRRRRRRFRPGKRARARGDQTGAARPHRRGAAARIVIASSSSGLLISRLQAACRHPERCVIGHPFNPPHLIPLVEVVGGERTAPATIERAMAFYARASASARSISAARSPGMSPTGCRRRCGARRCIWSPSGVASVADVDTAISEGPGLRWALMGPHLTFHLAGGAGGMAHFLDQLGRPDGKLVGRSGRPRLDAGGAEELTAGVAAEAGGRDIAALAAERDRFLVELLAIRQGEGH